MTIRKLLVFGATGTQGHPVVEEALAAGLEVRAATRDVADARARLTASAELVRADLLDAVSVTEAMAGCQAVFFHLNHMPDTGEAQQTVDNVLTAARTHGLERVVFTTSGYCGSAMPSCTFVDAARRLVAQVLSSEVPAVVLQPTLYLANLVWSHIITEIRDFGRLRYPPLPAERRLSWTSTEDQGRIAVACLQADVAGEAIDIASPEAVTGPELCRYLARVYGREVHFAPQSVEAFANDLSYQTGSAHSAQVISELYAAYARLDDGPRVDTDALQQRLGIELMPVSRWVEDRLGYLLSLYG